MTALTDPCPLPSAGKKKGLRDRDKLFYAPMSGIGDLVYDKDAVYININSHQVQYSKTDDGKGEPTNKGYFMVFYCHMLGLYVTAVVSFECLAHFMFKEFLHILNLVYIILHDRNPIVFAHFL